MTAERVPSQAEEWFARDRPRSQAKLRLFCFAYAGGAAAIYQGWRSQMPPTVEVIPVELPGRGSRLTQPPFRQVPILIAALTPKIVPLLDVKFALFGHSLRAIFAFELAGELRRLRCSNTPI